MPKIDSQLLKSGKKLQHLDRVDLGDRILIIHHTPGHSPGSICIEDTKHKILFTGDTYYFGTIFLHLPGSNYLDFVQSIGYLCSLLDQIEFLCPGHNEAYASKDVITALHQTIGKIDNQQVGFEINNASRLYQFDHFNMRLPLI